MKAVLLVLSLVGWTQGARILALLPLNIPSHHRFCEPIITELALKGHQVTVVTSIVNDHIKLPDNYKRIIIPGITVKDVFSKTAAEEFPDESSTHYSLQKHLWNGTRMMTEKGLASDAIKDLIYSTNEQFDLIIYEMFHHEAFLMFAHKYKVPLVGLSAIGYSPVVSNIMGNSLELSYARNPLLDMSSEGSFLERLQNTFWTIWGLVQRKRDQLFSQQELAEKYFGSLKQPLPSLDDIEKNTSLVLVNSHFTLDEVRTNVPGIIEVGGIHLRHAEKLPMNVASFIEGSKNGVVYLSLSGDNLEDYFDDKFKTYAELFKKAFSQMKLDFIFESESRDKHLNILFTRPLSSSQVLGNTKVKLIVSQGEQTHFHDAIAQGVPIIVIPSYPSQQAIARKVQKLKIGEVLNPEDLSMESIRKSIQSVLENEGYRKNIKELSQMYKDRPMDALDAAVYWIEYVIRYSGAQVLNSPAREFSWIQYNVADVSLFIIVSIVVIFLVLEWLWFNLALRKRLPRSEELTRLIEKEKLKTK